LKILHITASYKPAYIYGGPIYSVSALCEGLVKRFGSLQTEVIDQEQGGRSKDEGLNTLVNEVRSPQSAGLRSKEERSNTAAVDGSQTAEIEVITTLANGKEELPYLSGEQKIVEGVRVRYFNRWTKDHSHFSPALLFWLWKNVKKYDVVHVHSWWNLVSMGSVIICLMKGIKPIVSPRGMLGDYTFSKGKFLFHQIIGRALLTNCNFHATTMMEAREIELRVGSSRHKTSLIDLQESKVRSPQLTDELVVGVQKYLDQTMRIHVIHNIVKLPSLIPKKTRVFDETLHLIFLSRIHPKKGIELLMDALSQVSFPFQLSIVGEGEATYVESLKLKADSLKIKDRITWTGAIQGDEKFQILAEHDLFVLPSFNENFANVVIEALAVGTPVLISHQVGLSDFVQKNNLGLVHQHTVESLKEGLTHFMKNLGSHEKLINDDTILLKMYNLMYHDQ
jgi:glycosyltransferase involved in cell wall biosynthesis